ncbi:MAG: isoprenylcysteine carboxylmethyltransferase family protein [Chloroflexota bacterium]
MNENILRVLTTIIFLTGIGISVYFRRKADRDSGERVSYKDEGRPMFLILRLGGLLLWLSAFAYLINPAWMDWSRVNAPGWVRWTGVGVGILCDILLYWMFTSIGQGITPTVATRKSHKLVTHGIYKYVRHPLYSIGTAFFLSFALMAANWFFAGMAILAFMMLAIRLPNEEAHLIEKFGDEYREYTKRTGKFLPKIGGTQ